MYAQLHDAHRRTPEYERLTAEIHELAIAYRALVDAKHGITRPDPKP